MSPPFRQRMQRRPGLALAPCRSPRLLILRMTLMPPPIQSAALSLHSSPTRSTQLPPNSNDPPRPGNSSADVPTPAPPVLTMFSYLNIRGLIPQTVPSKVPYVTDELISTSAAFFAMTETWLTNSHLAAELQIDGYSIFRQDRQRKKAKFGRSSGGM